MRFLKNRRLLVKISVLVLSILTVGFILSGCVQGLQPIGWSGVAVSDGTLFVGSKEGRLVAIKTAADYSKTWSEPLKFPTPAGFGCAPSDGGGGGGLGGLGCSGEPAGVAIYGTPAISGDLVYVAGYNGKVFAFTASTLQTRWVYPREGYLKPIVGGIVASSGTLYFGDSEGKVYALDAATGDKKWEFKTGDEIWATPVISGNTLLIGSSDKKLYALDTATGNKKWEFQTDGAIISTPLVYDNTIYFSPLDRNLYALNEADHSLKWKFAGNNWFWAQPVILDGVLYAACLDGKVYLLDPKNGNKINEFDLANPISSSPVVVDKKVIVVTRDGKVYSLDKENKRLLATLTNVSVSAPLSASKNMVYIHTADLTVYAIDTATGAKLQTISLKKAE